LGFLIPGLGFRDEDLGNRVETIWLTLFKVRGRAGIEFMIYGLDSGVLGGGLRPGGRGCRRGSDAH
jgi:hypothetical protein